MLKHVVPMNEDDILSNHMDNDTMEKLSRGLLFMLGDACVHIEGSYSPL